MRVKTDARRQAIIEVATKLFQEVGYERASMAAIAARVGGSKQTLYGYFSSKEELFAVAMVAAMEERGHQLLDLLDPAATDLATTLRTFGAAYLAFISEPEIVRNNRIAIGAAGSGDLGAQLYQLGPRRFWGEVTGYLRGCVDRGQLAGAAPEMLSLHLQGLLEADIGEATLFGSTPSLTPEDAAGGAVAAFLKLYAPVSA